MDNEFKQSENRKNENIEEVDSDETEDESGEEPDSDDTEHGLVEKTDLNDFTDDELKVLIKRVTLIAKRQVAIMGMDPLDPDMDPEELTYRAFHDTLIGRRNKNPDNTWIKHFASTVDSYISNHKTSLKGKYRKETEFDIHEYDGPYTTNTPSPEEIENLNDYAKNLRSYVHKNGKHIEKKICDMVILKGMSTNDTNEIAHLLNLDPNNNSHMQRVYRGIRKFRKLCEDFNKGL